jgi:hypothetical protein
MTIEESKKIDVIGLSKDGKQLSLIITDHLDWNDPADTPRHLNMLQAKLNLYYAFLDSDKILESYPQLHELQVRIEVSFQHKPDDVATEFLDHVTAEVAKDGMEFKYYVFSE